MRYKGLTLFQKTNQSHYVIAAWHNPKSITWRWLIWWWPKFSLKNPFGIFYFATQENLWRRNCVINQTNQL